MSKTLGLALIATTAVLTAAACATGGESPCEASTCDGCCDSDGRCRTGDEQGACGARGAACTACSDAQVCLSRLCTMQPTGGGAGATGGGTGTGGGSGGGGAQRCGPTPVACADAAIDQLDLKVASSPDAVSTVADGDGWLSTIDTRAGGLTIPNSFVYARFGDDGLQKVGLGDQDALDSADWDIAFRRFVIRLNGGDSGPSCVAAARVNPGTTYDSVTSVPAGLTYETDDFLSATPACTFIDDGSGLTTSPNVVLAPFYAYESCVAMTGQVFIVRTSDQRHVKLVVTTYYATVEGQASCDRNGDSNGAAGGTVRIRWKFLD